jgi:hypothetical protein
MAGGYFPHGNISLQAAGRFLLHGKSMLHSAAGYRPAGLLAFRVLQGKDRRELPPFWMLQGVGARESPRCKLLEGLAIRLLPRGAFRVCTRLQNLFWRQFFQVIRLSRVDMRKARGVEVRKHLRIAKPSLTMNQLPVTENFFPGITAHPGVHEKENRASF